MPFPGFPSVVRKGQALVHDGVQWALSLIVTRSGTLTAGRLTEGTATPGAVQDSNIADAVTGNVLTIAGTLTGLRTQTARDASGNLCLDSVDNGFSVAQTITAGTVAQQRSLKLLGGDGAGNPGGIYLVSATASGGDGATVEAVGQRSDANGNSAFCGQCALAHLRTDAAMTTSGASLGRLKFGGNPTNTSLASVVYSAQMRGYASGAWSSSAAMPTGIIFSTGSAGVSSGSTVECGTDAVWVDHSGQVGIGVAPTAGNGLVQLASGTTKANGVVHGDTFQFRASSGNIFQSGPAATDIIYAAFRNTGETAYLWAGNGICYFGSSSATPVSIRTGNVAAINVDTAQGVTTAAANYGKVRSVAASSGTTTLDATDATAILTGAAIHTFTLPAASNGRRLFIKNRSSLALTVNRAGADTIDGLTTIAVATGTAKILIANGTDWCVWNA